MTGKLLAVEAGDATNVVIFSKHVFMEFILGLEYFIAEDGIIVASVIAALVCYIRRNSSID